nr:hypothetical protein [Legionella jordanis]
MEDEKQKTNNLYPPLIYNHEHKERRVGFEIEYVGISLKDSLNILKRLYSGYIQLEHDKKGVLKDSALGTFEVEQDAQLLKELAKHSKKNQEEGKIDLSGYLSTAIDFALNNIIPLEIISPPVRIKDIPKLDKIIDELRLHGAKDSSSSWLAAFGVHLNPDLPSLDADCILAYLQAFILLQDWLRKEIQVDLTRQLSTYIADFPGAYKLKILKTNYQPSLAKLMDDYLHYNSTRNRALDLLPLFAFIDKQKIAEQIDSDLVKARPTVHYRLPDSNFHKESRNFTTEWQRWLKVEQLAANRAVCQEMCRKYLEHLQTSSFSFDSQGWVQISEKYLRHL